MKLMNKLSMVALAVGAVLAQSPATANGHPAQPVTIVLVHGAFAESSSWNPVIGKLQTDGYKVIAAANPLRSLKTDADYVARIVAAVHGPVVLVGHSYGGEVISVAAEDAQNVKALVFVAGLAPDTGESAASLGKRFPGGTLGATLAPPIVQADGEKDLYIEQAKFRRQFAADSSVAAAGEMAATQRPITEAALGELAIGEPAWKRLPSWFIYGSADRNIPAALHAFMARRAHGQASVVLPGASHALMVTHPAEIAAMIERAASAR